jgi:hypothetical protein
MQIVYLPLAYLSFPQGVDDGLMPIEDSMILFEHGSPKEARQVLLKLQCRMGLDLRMLDFSTTHFIWDIHWRTHLYIPGWKV